MWTVALRVLTCVVAIFLVEPVFGDEDDTRLHMTAETFEAAMLENDHVLLNFFAPWCGHCKKLKPEFLKASMLMEEKGKSIALGMIDATIASDMAEKYEVRGYPTLLLFSKGVDEPEQYMGSRDAQAIVEWLLKVSGPAVTIVSNESESFPELEHATYLLGQFKSTSSDLYKAYEQIAETNRHNAQFKCMINPEAEEFIKIMRKNEPDVYYDKEKHNTLEEFYNAEKLALFAPIGNDNYRQYFENAESFVWVCGESTDFAELAPVMREVARLHRGSHAFVFLDTKTYGDHAKQTLDVHTYPAIVVHGKNGRFVMKHSTNNTENLGEEAKDVEKVKEFLENVKNNTHPRSIRSEEIPEEDDGPIKIVVGKNFQDVVMNSGKDVLLEVYAPWCHHCKKLEGTFKSLGEKFKGDSALIIAKMDGSQNESPVSDFSWQGFPTIFMLKAGNTVPIKHDGERTLESLVEFVNKNRATVAPAGSEVREEL